MTPHPDSPKLQRALLRCLPLASEWSGDVYRFAAPRWATADELLTGNGALHAGGRWHPIGVIRAVYGSLDPETALAEAQAHYRRFGLDPTDAMPRTLNAVRVRLHRVLMLTDGHLRKRLRLSWERIRAEAWWERGQQGEEALTQAFGRLAWENKVEALLVPSAARPAGEGLVYFPDCKLPQSRLEIVNADQLPRK